MYDFTIGLIMGAIITLIIGFISVISIIDSGYNYYSRGYCEALGGEYNNELCIKGDRIIYNFND